MGQNDAAHWFIRARHVVPYPLQIEGDLPNDTVVRSIGLQFNDNPIANRAACQNVDTTVSARILYSDQLTIRMQGEARLNGVKIVNQVTLQNLFQIKFPATEIRRCDWGYFQAGLLEGGGSVSRLKAR